MSSASSAFGRRSFLVASSVGAGLAIVTAACRSSDDDSSGDRTTTTQAGPPSSGDLLVASLASGLEVLAITTYKATLDAASAGKLGAVPEAGRTFVQTALDHHQEHLGAWNKMLKDAARREITEPDTRLKPAVDAQLAKANTFADVAKLALMLEEVAAATFLSAVSQLTDTAAVKKAASIQAVEAKHAAFLHYVLGDYPVPDTFAKEDKAAKA